MNKQLVQELYNEAVALCDQQEAWLFEENFTKVIVNRCATILESQQRVLFESAHYLREYFGISRDEPQYRPRQPSHTTII